MDLKVENPPAYRLLAEAIKVKIASGQYPKGARIPSEVAISREHGLSTMTVRQAVNLLTQEGLLTKVQGSGTYVAAPSWIQAKFGWATLERLLEDRQNISWAIFKISLAAAGPKTSERLMIPPLTQVIFQDRLIHHKGRPVLLNHSVLRFDPRSPVVEAELEMMDLMGPWPVAGQSVKKHLINVTPVALGAEEAQSLEATPGELSLKIAYELFDFNDSIFGLGWFLAPRKLTNLSARIGFWSEF
ncbi:MAG: GntR family transcriptional regulator [Deltaproteobacteria bacterium]|jgi:GntR family transcriptional regulator|nr:GntR family transcriptional regulator [Deltaproteobacteria bacterium]